MGEVSEPAAHGRVDGQAAACGDGLVPEGEALGTPSGGAPGEAEEADTADGAAPPAEPSLVPASVPPVPAEPPEPEPLGVAPVTTGNLDVDPMLARLGEVDALPTHQHLAVYEEVHAGLYATLAALDQHSDPSPEAQDVAAAPSNGS